MILGSDSRTAAIMTRDFSAAYFLLVRAEKDG